MSDFTLEEMPCRSETSIDKEPSIPFFITVVLLSSSSASSEEAVVSTLIRFWLSGLYCTSFVEEAEVSAFIRDKKEGMNLVRRGT